MRNPDSQQRGAKCTNVEVVETIEEIGREPLEKLADDFCYTYGWLKTIETLRVRTKLEPRYLVVYEEGKMIAFIPTYIASDYRYFSAADKNPIIKTVVNVSNQLGIHIDHGRALTCDPPDCSHSRIPLEKSVDAKAILDAVSAKIDELCRKEKIPISCFRGVSEFDVLLKDNLRDFGYFNTSTTTNFYLDILWSSFDEYVSSLEYRTRKNLRREIRKCRESGITIEEEKFENCVSTLSKLYSNLYSKYHPHEYYYEDAYFFGKLLKYAKEKTRVFLAKKNGRVVGFSIGLQNRDILDVWICGFDYGSLTKTDFAYSNVTYYAPIRAAIEEGFKRMYYRWSMERTKLRLGCKPEKLSYCIRIHNSLLRPLAGLYVRGRQATSARY
jgi:predicted N-acyltransferase